MVYETVFSNKFKKKKKSNTSVYNYQPLEAGGAGKQAGIPFVLFLKAKVNSVKRKKEKIALKYFFVLLS